LSEARGTEGEHMLSESERIRVLVVDDSAVMRKLIPDRKSTRLNSSHIL